MSLDPLDLDYLELQLLLAPALMDQVGIFSLLSFISDMKQPLMTPLCTTLVSGLDRGPE